MARLQDHFSSNSTNRVAEAIYAYAEDEAKLKIHNPIESWRDLYDIDLKLNYYKSLVKAYRKTKNALEKKALVFVRHEIRRLTARRSPTSFNRFYYSDTSEKIKNWLRGKNDPVTSYHRSIQKLEKELIQDHNLQFLSSQLKKAGFNLEMEGSLLRMINQNLPQFHLRYADIENPDAHYVVHFKKVPGTDLYYFEKFDAISRPSLDALLKNDPNCSRQTFYVRDDIKISASEAAKLVNGKSICRSVNGLERWISLDKSSLGNAQYQFFRFDLEEALMKLPILERENSNKYQSIIQALKNGIKKEVTFHVNGEPLKCKLEAVPVRQSITIFDNHSQTINLEGLSNTVKNARKVFQKVEEYKLEKSQIVDNVRTLAKL